MTDDDLKQVRISTACYNEIEQIVQQSEQFDSVSDYVNFVLRELLFGDDEALLDDEMVKNRLKALGYL